MNDEHRTIKLIMALRTRGIRNTNVLAAIERVPRESFVPETFRPKAYEDQSLPIECGQTISQPYVVAFMTQALDVSDRMKVLEIGTGSGYQTAVLSHLCRRIYTIERYRTLLREAEERFRELRISNVTSMAADGIKGWPQQAPFDRIIVTAAAPEIPQTLIEQLKVGGTMIIPVDKGRTGQELVKLVREEDAVRRESLLPVRFVPLVKGLAREI